jgi:hypothetical protein
MTEFVGIARPQTRSTEKYFHFIILIFYSQFQLYTNSELFYHKQ